MQNLLFRRGSRVPLQMAPNQLWHWQLIQPHLHLNPLCSMVNCTGSVEVAASNMQQFSSVKQARTRNLPEQTQNSTLLSTGQSRSMARSPAERCMHECRRNHLIARVTFLLETKPTSQECQPFSLQLQLCRRKGHNFTKLF